jgi:hypothetical protein
MLEGIVPDIRVNPNCKKTNAVKSPMLFGIIPFNGLECIARNINLFNFPMLDGILPVNEFSAICKLVKLFKYPMDNGIVPVIEYKEMSSPTISFPLHVTPLHRVLSHTGVKGVLSVHRQPFKPDFVPRLVDVAKSHNTESWDIVGTTVGKLVGIEVGRTHSLYDVCVM